MAKKFKVGDIIVLKNDYLVRQGWNSNLMLQITATDKNCYRYIYIITGSDRWPKGMSDAWNTDIIEDNFKMASKAVQVLYGYN